MLAFFIFCIPLANAGFYEDHFKQIQQDLKKAQNKNGKISWKAGLNPFFAEKSLEEIKTLMGYDEDMLEATNEKEEELSKKQPSEELILRNMTNDLPTQFDSRKNWPECKELISHIKDQSNCGSCWAVASASVMTDRTCIATKGRMQNMLSDEELLSCCENCGYGCGGGSIMRAFKYWVRKGLPTGGPYGDEASCKPYTIKPCHRKDCGAAKTPKCTTSCIDKSNHSLSTDRHYGRTWFNFWFGERAIMRDIYLNGPVTAGFEVYSDFLYYKSGVYEHKTGSKLGGHAVRIIGWGVEDGKKYWLVANSWNTTFGESGLFKIRKGVDECGIEYRVTAGYAKA